MSMSHEVSRVHQGLIEGRVKLSRAGRVAPGPGAFLPWVVRDAADREVEPVSSYLRDRMLGDVSPLTCRSYAYDLLRWFRVLWTADVGWEQATEMVNNGLPIHIGAALLGHLNIQTTRGYVAVFDDDVIAHYQQFLERRRAGRPESEYRQPSTQEWSDFQEHFDKRRVELGSCGRPYGTGCTHEHACIRCPMLSLDPKMLPRLDELEEDLLARRQRATDEGWRGEIEGLDLTLSFLRGKRAQARRNERSGSPGRTDLGMPDLPQRR